jgi:hypothetical protein
MRTRVSLLVCAALAVIAASAASAQAGIARQVKPVGWGPISDKAAAERVHRSSFEPRPDNYQANHTVPGKRQLAAWRAKSTMPYARYVDGRFKGTTDEIIQWAAHKWGLPPNLLRAVAATESWWHQSALGDNGDSFGLFQVRRPYHCFGNCAIARDSTAFNADYYGGIIRSYYDGTQTWLNTVENGRPYEAGDIWGSLGAWYSGRWWVPSVQGYVDHVKQNLADRPWFGQYF